MLRGKFVLVNTYTKKLKDLNSVNINFHLQILAKEEQTKLKQARKERKKTRAEIN